jgi:hypothetical protein
LYKTKIMNLYSFRDQSNSEKHLLTNLRQYERNIPSQSLQPYLDSRPVMTKYSLLPIVDPRKPTSTPLIQQSTYNQHQQFNPGDSAPWSGYANNVNHESELRNQIYGLQKCPQSVYVPTSQSSLYTIQWQNNQTVDQPFPGLFRQEKPANKNVNTNSNFVGYALFNNATRQQTKNLI